MFVFRPGFIARAQVTYRDVASILKINGGLTAPFTVLRGVLSLECSTLAIEPLLHKIRKTLMGVSFPGCRKVVKLTAYADDVVILFLQPRGTFWVDWWCRVQTGGLKYLGVFFKERLGRGV